MAEDAKPVRVDEIDWSAIFPFLNLFKTFRLAIHPPKLLLALLLGLLLLLYGLWLEGLSGARVYPGEIAKFGDLNRDGFEQWRQEQPSRLVRELEKRLAPRAIEYHFPPDSSLLEKLEVALTATRRYYGAEIQQRCFVAAEEELAARRDRGELSAEAFEAQRLTLLERRDRGELAVDRPDTAHRQLMATCQHHLAEIRQLRPEGMFRAALRFKLRALRNLFGATLELDGGLADLVARRDARSDSIVGALRDLSSTLPRWLLHAHPWLFLAWTVGAWALVALLGGAICRLAAVHAGRDERLTVRHALLFARQKWLWLFLAPVIPLVLVLLVMLSMAFVGMVFNLPVLDLLGAVLFGLALFGGLVGALVLLGLAGGLNLLCPAIAAEGSEAFDAISRAYHYVFFRPWRMLGYCLAGLVYGAATMLFVAVVVVLATVLAHQFAGAWVWTSGSDGAVNRFDLIMPLREVLSLSYDPDLTGLDTSGRIAAYLIRGWVLLALGFVWAYGASYWCCVHTWIYLLLRRVADGNVFDDIYMDAADGSEVRRDVTPAAPDKVEPPEPALGSPAAPAPAP